MELQILVTNDDGILSPALDALEASLSALGNVLVVAPAIEMSATSHGITLNQPLRFQQLAPNRYSVQGTPADCVIVAAMRILHRKPDLVISGVNRGLNVGEDVAYSGTVAAAFEAALQGIPGIAVSAYAHENPDFAGAAEVAARIAARVLADRLPADVILNVNHPERWNGGIRLTRQGRRADKTVFAESLDSGGREYLWLREELHLGRSPSGDEPMTDFAAVAAGFVSVCPLQIDRTAHSYSNNFARWVESLDLDRARS